MKTTAQLRAEWNERQADEDTMNMACPRMLHDDMDGMLVKLEAVIKLVNEQAEDKGLFFYAQTLPEAYLQDALRKLHAALEDKDVPNTN